MIKKFFLFVVMMCLASVGSWADDVTTIESQTQWTFGTYAGQSAKVFNQNGMYLHAASTFDTFTVDADHAASLEGTFTGTNVAWQTTGALVAATGVGSNFLSLGNIDAASEGGADASLAFSHQGSGRLYVVYGAVSSEDGTFYVQQRKDGETAFTTVFSETLQGISYSGPLNAPVYNRAAGDYSFTQKESVVSLSGNGTVYLGADQPYCIYAIFWIPTYLDNPAYGTYDFQTWAEKNMTANNQATISVTADGTMTGAFTPASGDITGTMELNGVFSITGEAYKLRKNGSTGNNNSGLMITKTGGAKVTINRLQAGDWFTVATDVAERLQFATDNANVHAVGSTETITADSYVESGTIYIATAATTVDVYSKTVGTVYIHKVQISNEDAVSAPVITVGENNLVTINGGTSLKGNAVTVYYTTDNTDPKTSETRQVYSAPFTPTETVKVRAYSVLTSDETIVSDEAEPQVVRIGTWTGETNVFDFASAAKNYVDITFSDTKLDGIKMYGGGSSPNADANFYEITNTDWLTAGEGNTAKIGWRDKGAKFDGDGLMPNGQTYFTIANLTAGQRVQIELYGQLRYRTGVSDEAPVVLNGGSTVTTDTYLGVKNSESTINLTIQSGSYMVFLCAANDVVIKKITVLEPVPTYTLTVAYDTEKGTVTANDAEIAESYEEGTVVSLMATATADGYQFAGWTDAEDNRLSLANPYEVTMTENITLKAVFKQPTTPAVAITEETTWTFDALTPGTILSGTKVYEYDNLYISGHNDDTKNQATVLSGSTVSTGIAGDVTNYVNIAGKNNGTQDDASTFNQDAVAFKTGKPGYVEFYDKGKKAGAMFNVFVNGTKYQTAETADFQLIRQDVTGAENTVFFSTSDGGHMLYAVKFTPETVTSPTIAADGTITNGESNLIADDSKQMVTYYTIDGTEPTTASTQSTGSIKTEGSFTVKAFTVNSVTGTQSEVVEQEVTVTLPNNLGTTVPVILVAGQSNADGRVPADELPSIDTEYTGLQNCYWSYCNAAWAGGSGLKTPYTTEGDFKLYEPLNDAGGGWGFDAVVYNEIGKYIKENYNEPFYVVKQSKGNTGISPVSGGCALFWSANPVWLSRSTKTNEGGASLLKSLIDNIDASLEALKTQYPDKEADIKFLMWHQGECDGAGGQGAVYYTQLKAMINYVRNYLAQKNAKYSNLPIILGGIPAISDQYREEVEAAKQQLANEDVNIYYVSADMMTNKETDLLPESTTVHFNAKSAKAFGAAIWQVINDNHLLYGLQDGTGTSTPVDDILAETVVEETTKWNFSEEAANTKYTTLTDKNGLYLIASASKNMTVKEMTGVTSVKYRDGEEVETTKALYTEAADRTNYTKYGLTAGDPSSLDRSFGVNVGEAGTFYAIVAPNTEPSEAQASRNIFLVVNGEKVVEKNALEAWGNDNHMVELKYKMTAPGTIFLMSSHAYNLYAAKFVKSGEEHDPVEVTVDTEDGNATETVTILDENNAELTAVTIEDGATTLIVKGSVSGTTAEDVPITAIVNSVFTAANTANLAAIDLSATAITLSGERSSISALKNINEATLIYLPATANVTGTNVVTMTSNGFVCDDYQISDGNTCAVPHDFTATSATMNRTFIADKKSTVCLPFSFTAAGGTFYKFTGINDGKVQMTAQQDGSTLDANTPYIFEPENGTQTIAAENVGVSISDAPQTDNMEAQYSFIGTYQPIVWENPVGIYGFAAEAQGPTSIGQFVRVGSGASIAACRSYLQYTGEGTITEARSNRSMSELPERYDIQWILSGETTMITTVKNTAADAARCYNLNGQLVNDSYRGIVIKNGKTMIKK